MAFGKLRRLEAPEPVFTPIPAVSFYTKLPHVDPMYPKGKKPPGSNSEIYVQCDKCCAQHRICDRKMFNGTYSYCPVCNYVGCTWA